LTSSARLLFFLLGAACLARVVPASIVKPFWHDEIYTIVMSRQPSLAAMWSAAEDGVDLSPPLNAVITRGVHAVFGVGHVWTRIPPLAGFSIAVCVIFLLLYRRAGTTAALTGALLPFVTAGLRFASEARPYGLMMGLAAISLYCWMEAAAGRHRPVNLVLLAIAIAASIWNHYFGVLVIAPIVAGECVRVAATRRIDRGVAMALGAGIVAALPLYGLAAASAAQRSTFWARVSWSQLPDAYVFILNALWSVPAAVIAVALALVLALWRRKIDGDVGARTIASHEAVAIAAAIAVPLLAVLIGRFATGVFIPRYALAAVPGLSIAIALATWRLNVRRSPAELLLCVALACVVAADTRSAIVRARDGVLDPLAGRTALIESLRGATPTVMSSSLQFLQFWYYLPPELKPRLHYLADPQRAFTRTGSDTIDRGYLALARWSAVAVDPFETYVQRHPGFRVYEAGSGWLIDELIERGAAVEEITHDPAGGRLFQVTLRQ
jgi:hypothetical protein